MVLRLGRGFVSLFQRRLKHSKDSDENDCVDPVDIPLPNILLIYILPKVISKTIYNCTYKTNIMDGCERRIPGRCFPFRSIWGVLEYTYRHHPKEYAWMIGGNVVLLGKGYS